VNRNSNLRRQLSKFVLTLNSPQWRLNKWPFPEVPLQTKHYNALVKAARNSVSLLIAPAVSVPGVKPTPQK